MEKMDLDRVQELVKLFGASHARDLTVTGEGWHLSLRRNGAKDNVSSGLSPTAQTVLASVDEELPAPGGVPVTAPMVDIFRQGECRLKVGDPVMAGATVGGIESMKILNPVVSEVSGTIVDVMVEDGQPVEYSQQLLLVLPTSEPLEEADE